MKHFFRAGLLALFAVGSVNAQVTTFDYTGSVQTYTVPVGVTSIQIEAFGAQGGGTYGGYGGRSLATVPVTPGAVLEVYVGEKPLVQLGPGGFNGGGAVATLPCGGGSDGWPGGGASDVRTSAALADRMIVAGGGGGQGWSNGVGGAGGGLSGEDGEASWIVDTNGKAGTPASGGAGGAYGGFPPAGTGVEGVGGNSGPLDTYCTGGGGGGGWYGGGGGFVSAGAGGSSYIGYPGTIDELTEIGVRAGNGQIIITVLCEVLTVAVTDDVICLGDSFTLDAEGVGEITWDGGVTNGEPFTPTETGVITYIATSDSDLDCGFSIDIEVLALPDVTATADIAEICDGESVVLTGGGADSYSWDPADVADGDPYEPEVGTTTFTVTGTDAEGCQNTAEVEVTVNELPEVVATATDTDICLGESVTLNGGGAVDYTWEPTVEDGIAFTPDAVGSTMYMVTGTDDNGCVGQDEIEINVYEALAISYVVTEEIGGADGEINITVTGGNPPYSFDWDNDGTGDFDDDEDLTGLTGGTYVVVVSCEAGCTISETVSVGSQVGLEELNELGVKLYPNPSSDQITIAFEGEFAYELTNANGSVVLKGIGFNTKQLSVEELANGIYIIQIKAGDKSASLKLIKE